MKMLFALAAFTVAACASPASVAPHANDAISAPAPQWWRDHVAFITRDGGIWVSPNPPGASDQSQPDAFAMEWRAAYGDHLLIGRLYGLRNGQEIAEYWSFREFWHPGEGRAVLQQWGGPGVYGAGESRWENGAGVTEQTFWLPDGRSWREGHRNRERGDEYETHAFDIDDAGNWISKDPRVWRRQAGVISSANVP